MRFRLKELRKVLKLSMREVAEKLDVSTGLVGQWESGQTVPKVRIYQICKEFNVNRTWLETGAGDMFQAVESLPNPSNLSTNPASDKERYINTLVELYGKLPKDLQDVLAGFSLEIVKRNLLESSAGQSTETTTNAQAVNVSE